MVCKVVSGIYHGVGGRVRCVPWAGKPCQVCTMG